MSTNTETIRRIQAEFANLQNEKRTLDGNHSLSFREAVRALYPTLRDMKKRGFNIKDIADKMNEYGINIKHATLCKYMNEMKSEETIKKSKGSRASSPRRARKSAPKSDKQVIEYASATTSKTE